VSALLFLGAGKENAIQRVRNAPPWVGRECGKEGERMRFIMNGKSTQKYEFLHQAWIGGCQKGTIDKLFPMMRTFISH